MSTPSRKLRRTGLALALIAATFAASSAAMAQGARAASDFVNAAGGPGRGEVTRGVLLRPQGCNRLDIIGVRPEVTFVRIEQDDYAVPAVGPNPNRLLLEGAPGSIPNGLVNRSLDLTPFKSIKFTVQTNSAQRLPDALRMQWCRR